MSNGTWSLIDSPAAREDYEGESKKVSKTSTKKAEERSRGSVFLFFLYHADQPMFSSHTRS